MSNINPIPTTQIVAGSTGVTNHQALSGSQTSGVLAGAGMAGGMANFWDMIIAQFTTPDTQAATPPTTGLATGLTNMPTSEKKSVAQNDNPLALLQIALASQPVDEQGNIVLDTPINPEKIQSKLDLTNQIIDHLKTILPEGTEKDGLLKTILTKLQAKSDTLQASLSVLNGGVITKDTPVEDIPLPMMIALGLNPSEISEVTEKIQALEEKLGREITVEDLIAGVGGIIPPSPETAIVAIKTSTKAPGMDVIDTIDENSQPTDDLAAQLNAIDVGGNDDASKDAEAGLTNTVKSENDDVSKKPMGLPLKEGSADTQTAPDASSAKKDNAAFKENLVNLLNSLNKPQQGDMLFPATMFGAQTDSAIFQPYGLSATPALSLGTTAQAASMISSSIIAGQVHPATHMVAATLVRSAKGGDDSTINLRLDPPELGNVSVRLQFGKDKTVKAHIMVEKPETFMMLQRESHSLERALQSAGLDTQGQAISFELAQDNSAFRHNNNGDNANNNFGGGGPGPQDAGMGDEIIQSSMTWQVDPMTGHMRYNILA